MSADATDLARCERCGYERQACDCPRCADCGTVWNLIPLNDLQPDTTCVDCDTQRFSLSLTDFDPPRPQDIKDEYDPIDDDTAEQITQASDEDNE